MSKILYAKDFSNSKIENCDISELSDIMRSVNESRSVEQRTGIMRYAIEGLLIAERLEGKIRLEDNDGKLLLSVML